MDRIKRYTHFSISGIILIFTLSLSACGDSDPDSADNPDNTSPIFDTNGQYDLAEYLFNDTLSVTLNSVSYPVTFYSKDDGTQVFQFTDKFVKTSDDTIAWTTDDAPSSTYTITATSIDEIVHNADNALRISQRFVDVGDVYLNANADTILGTQNATCTLVNHLTSIDLSTLTGSFSLATGIYNDVLEVECVTGFVSQGSVVPHTTLTYYFAQGVGIVLTEGSIIIFGDVYMVPTL